MLHPRFVRISEYDDTKPRETPKWFALGEDRPLFAFAGLWTPWRDVRGPKSAPIEGEHELSAFLTMEPNAIVAPIHPKAMPVILTTPAEVDQWLESNTLEALKLQRPLPDEALKILGEAKTRSTGLHAAFPTKPVRNRSRRSLPACAGAPVAVAILEISITGVIGALGIVCALVV